jgi:pilus assembly protein CpaE
VKPASSDLLADALGRAVRSEGGTPVPAKSARLFAFVGARGGVGTTTLALATAWILAHEVKLRTALIDLDLHFGNLALNLDLEPGRGLREALERPERTDNLLLASAMVRDGDKLPILAAEEPLEDMLGFAPEAATPLLSALRHDYDCIVADVPRSLDAVARKVLAAADQVVVVTDLSLAAVRDSLRLVDLVRAFDAQGKPLIVANQVGAAHRGEIGRPEFERGLAGPVDLAVPFDVKAAVAAARSGKAWPAAAGSSKATVELKRLAARLSGREAKPRGGLFRLFG